MSQSTRSTITCIFRNIPTPFRFTLFALPTAFAVGALGFPAASSAWGDDAGVQLLTTNVSAQQAVARTVPAPSARGTQARLKAYFRAGYDYDDAVLLARLWSNATTPQAAKLRAGALIVDGDRVPVRPNQPAWRVGDAVALQAFFNNGYTYRDAQKIARAWKRPRDIGGVKATAGRYILAGRPLPGVSAAQGTRAKLDAYFRAGYDYDDAVLLSRLWSFETSPYAAKLRAGMKLMSGEALPIERGDDAWKVSDDTALDAYFNNGYDYSDAQKLAKTWSMSDTRQVKVNAGHKLLAGLPLPVRS